MDAQPEPLVETSTVRKLRAHVRARGAKRVRLLLHGEPGVGKATAADALLDEWPPGTLVLRGRPDPLGAPFLALLGAFQGFVMREARQRERRRLALEVGGELVRLLPLLGHLGGPLSEVMGKTEWFKPRPVSSHQDIVHLLRRIVRKAAAERPVVLVMRSVDAYDSSSLSALLSLLEVQDVDVSFVFTLDRTVAPIQVGALGGTQDLLDILRRSLGFSEADVLPFTVDETAAYLSGRAGGPVAPGDVQLLQDMTGGVPLFLAELGAFLEQRGAFEPGDGLHGHLAAAVPENVRSIIRARLATLDRDLRSLVDVASVLGFEFQSLPLAGVLRAEHIQVLRQLRELEQTHRFVRELADSHRFRHGLVRNHVYEALGGSLAREHHLLVAKYLERHPLDSDNEYALYIHYEQARRPEEAALHLELSAAESRRRLCHRDAAGRFAEAARLRAALQPADEARCQALRLQAGIALHDAGVYPDAIRLLEGLTGPEMEGRVRAQAIMYRAFCEYLLGDYPATERSLELLLRHHRQDLGEELQAQARLAMASVLYHTDRWEAARKQYQKVFLFEGPAAQPIRREALKRVNMFYRTELAAPFLECELASWPANGRDETYWQMRHNLACNHLFLGRLDEARDGWEASLEHFEAVASHRVAYPHSNLAILGLVERDFTAAQGHIDAVLAAPLGSFDRLCAEIHRAVLGVLEDRLGPGIQQLTALMAATAREPVLHRVVRHNLGWAHAKAGNRDEAARLLRVPKATTPEQRMAAAQARRLLARSSPTEEPDADALFLGRTGHREAWIYRDLDFRFSDVWFWE